MKMYRLLLHLPLPIKGKLDALRREGYTASGFIRALLERELETHTHHGQRAVTNGKTK